MNKPNAHRYGWDLVRTEHPYTHTMFKVRQDWVRWPDGVERPFTYIETPPVVQIIPVTCAGDIVLIRQYRYIPDAWFWELPAGGSYNFNGDDLADLARRELHEEIGGEAQALQYLGTFRPGLGLLNEVIHTYLATGVELGTPDPEPGELIEIHPTSVDRALEMARNGEIISAPSAYVLLRFEDLLRTLEIRQ